MKIISYNDNESLNYDLDFKKIDTNLFNRNKPVQYFKIFLLFLFPLIWILMFIKLFKLDVLDKRKRN